MAVTETFVLEGHIVGSLLLAEVLDLGVDAGADHVRREVSIGRTATGFHRTTDLATVVRVADRSSHRGGVTDVGPSLRQLADLLEA